LKKNFSFVIVDKSATIDKRMFICEQGLVCKPITITGEEDESGYGIQPKIHEKTGKREKQDDKSVFH